MRLYAFDPGKTTGWAMWDTSKNDKPLMFGDESIQSLNMVLDGLTSEIDVIVYENYRIRIDPKNKGFAHRWDTAEAPRRIGAIEYRASQLDIPVVAQEPSILKVGCAWANIPHNPKSHLKDHLSAIAHGTYYLVRQNEIIPHGK